MFTKEEQKRLKELMDSNDEFAYFINQVMNECKLLTSQIAHEIRNPLTLIKSTAQLIESAHPEVKTFQHWDQLTSDINDLEALLNEVSVFNHSESIVRRKQDFLQLLKSVVSNFQPLARQNGIDLSLTIAEADIPYYTSFPIDKVKMNQVFTNLLQNAFEATERGCYIKIICKALPPSHLEIKVQNNGQMIPSDELPNIFKPFVTYKPNGSGLGLAISSNIIAAHNGTIEVTSTKEVTSFIIQLPLSE
ncbi:MAG: histidine kinase [Lachnoclostridium sp.]|jgi:signal transduction histidine kinase